MTIREKLEERERQTLSPMASLSAESRGRQFPAEPCPIRTEYQRDRDRIIHSNVLPTAQAQDPGLSAPRRGTTTAPG